MVEGRGDDPLQHRYATLCCCMVGHGESLDVFGTDKLLKLVGKEPFGSDEQLNRPTLSCCVQHILGKLGRAERNACW